MSGNCYRCRTTHLSTPGAGKLRKYSSSVAALFLVLVVTNIIFGMGWTFRKALRDELDFQGLTVKELAAKSTVAKGALDSYLGKQASIPPADTAVRIAGALGLTVEYLINGRNNEAEKAAPFFSNPRKRSMMRIFDELLPDDQQLTLDFARLLKNRAENRVI